MMRAPMSRMDVLSPKELETLLEGSQLVTKYNDEIDRESAYEILNKKIEKAEKTKAKEEAREVKSKRRTTSRRSTRQNPIVKVLTSATFLRAAFGILKKVIK